MPDNVKGRTIPFIRNHWDKGGGLGLGGPLTANRLVENAQVLASSPEFLRHCVSLVSNFIIRSKVLRPTGTT